MSNEIDELNNEILMLRRENSDLRIKLETVSRIALIGGYPPDVHDAIDKALDALDELFKKKDVDCKHSTTKED
jgi:uncharacterized coiled-coil DUF342 family protein